MGYPHNFSETSRVFSVFLRSLGKSSSTMQLLLRIVLQHGLLPADSVAIMLCSFSGFLQAFQRFLREADAILLGQLADGRFGVLHAWPLLVLGHRAPKLLRLAFTRQLPNWFGGRHLLLIDVHNLSAGHGLFHPLHGRLLQDHLGHVPHGHRDVVATQGGARPHLFPTEGAEGQGQVLLGLLLNLLHCDKGGIVCLSSCF
mmetsp:Transcript_74524/g.123128  ORF Transcript_74524/g.123128 Transcript_74524/m.123128 type:complete len:200 (-) Transcript_74524:227-826(-)